MFGNRLLLTRLSKWAHVDVVQKTKSNILLQSPTSKKRKVLSDKAINIQAFNELLSNREANGGLQRRGDILKIVNVYNNDGHACVTRRSIEYLFEKVKAGKPIGIDRPSISIVGGVN